MTYLEYVFPSPFGVHILKFDNLGDDESLVFVVSVPFRGSCSEMRQQKLLRIMTSASNYTQDVFNYIINNTIRVINATTPIT